MGVHRRSLSLTVDDTRIPIYANGDPRSPISPKWPKPSINPRDDSRWRRLLTLRTAALIALGIIGGAALLNSNVRKSVPHLIAAVKNVATTSMGEPVEEMYTVAVILDEIPYVDRTRQFVDFLNGKHQSGFPPVEWTSHDFLPPYPCCDGKGLPSLSSVLKPSDSLSVQHAQVFPRKIVLPDTAPAMEELMLMSPAFMGRLNTSLHLYEHAFGGTGIGCIITFDPSDKAAIEDGTIPDAFRAHGMECRTYVGRGGYVAGRAFDFVKHAMEYALARAEEVDTKWFLFGDDDTLWVDSQAIQRTLSRYDPDQDWLIGARTEATAPYNKLHGTAFGGAGFFISRSLMAKLHDSHAECKDAIEHNTWNIHGGDEMISFCAAKVLDTTEWDLLEESPYMHQTDVQGDRDGFYQAGIPPLTLHHTVAGGMRNWWGGFSKFPNTTHLEAVDLFGRAVNFLGADIIFTRTVFESGRVLLVHGYSITIYETPLERTQLEYVELTMRLWSQYRFPTRPGIPEGPWRPALKDSWKTSYYLWSVRELDANSAEFVYSSLAGEKIRVLYVDGRPMRT